MNTIGWWLVGYGIAFGTLPIPVLFHNACHSDFGKLLFYWTLMSVSTKIVSVIIFKYREGCIAERMKLQGYLIFSLFQACWIFPSVVRSAWGGGILADLGYVDHAGGGVVHLLGGICGLTCILFLPPRQGRFDSPERESDFRPNNIVHQIFM